jgi:hypothetical protein
MESCGGHQAGKLPKGLGWVTGCLSGQRPALVRLEVTARLPSTYLQYLPTCLSTAPAGPHWHEKRGGEYCPLVQQQDL